MQSDWFKAAEREIVYVFWDLSHSHVSQIAPRLTML
jgi:hypothetical protein